MTGNLKHYITLNNKKYFYTLKDGGNKTTIVKCEAAGVNQPFLNEDVPALLRDLPNLILAEKEYKNQQSEVIRFRITPEDKQLIEKRAIQKGYSSISGFLRDLALGKG